MPPWRPRACLPARLLARGIHVAVAGNMTELTLRVRARLLLRAGASEALSKVQYVMIGIPMMTHTRTDSTGNARHAP